MEVKDLIQLKGKKFALDVETTGLHWWKDGLIGICVYCPELGINEYIYTCEYRNLEIPQGRKKKVWTGETVMQATGESKPKKVWTGTLTPKGTKVWEVRNEPVYKKEKVYRMEQAVKYEFTAVPVPELVNEAKRILQEVMSDPATVVVFHNSRFDCHFLDLDMERYPCMVLDTSIMVYLYDSRLRKSLDACEQKFLGSASKRTYVGEIPKALKKKHRCWPPQLIADYGKNDALVTWQLAEVLVPKLRKLKLMELFKIDMQYSAVLWQIERKGMVLNTAFCNQAIQAFTNNLGLMEQEMYDSVGYTFNWRSNPQLSKAIYENLGIERPKNPFANAEGIDNSKFALKGKYNKYATSSFLLMEKAKHPLGGLILDLREATKLRKTVQKYLELMDAAHVIHTNFNQTRTRTGRLSSTDPNVQNIASAHRVRETQSAYSGGAIRQNEYNLRMAFMSRPGYSFVSVDHAQQEQRLFAVIANEPVMLQALKDRLDIHLMIALEVWGDCGKEANKLHREWSKTISFGLLYGMTLGSLKYRLNKTSEEADEITSKYWGKFPRVQPWLLETVDSMQNTNKIRYWSGRIWREEDPEYFYRGCNAQIQGGAADLIKLAIIRAQRVCGYMGWGNVASIIHDEIMVEVKDEYLAEAIPVLVRIMELQDIFGLPFKAEAKVGKTYGEMDDWPVGDVSSIDWTAYAPPGFDMNKYTLRPWDEIYGKDKERWKKNMALLEG